MSYRDRGGGGGSRAPRVSLVVRNLPLDIRAEDLRSKFEKYGELKDVYIPRDYYTQRPRGFGFVEFKDTRDAEDAMYSLDRSTINGREISVTFSREGRKTPRDMMKIEARQKGYDDRYDDRRHDDRRHDDRRHDDRRHDDRRRSRSRSPRRRYSRSPRRSRSRSPRRSRERERDRSPREASPRDRSPRDRSPRERSPHELSPRDRDNGREPSRDRSPRERDYERSPRERDYERSPRERSLSRGRSPSPRRESPPRPEAAMEEM
ncbi:hypothetical protein VOLCADRAFT_120666 [Volvox carteri f. nagariensis]|uniref:RRM domain-containing protein n=1 Tax=Volvox carteri f. nagariensis TaxID=3068 RepID=D8TQU8_VOLCA|nr:uncharacterized protein VOLCADRAFT_120666 [Volvox carteri f. nagariensis]EFJ50216.1 hypothetical protein VOLCADRAFT_120666 [Volvox carteri f. nagariensis]|eukprot:XP_002948836.1 hypothetical protein VOLCADRAFT_120666 [Volvox carteri f. nagariensis]